MTLKTLLPVTCGKIAIYKAVDDTPDTDYVDLYVGDVKQVPQELLNRKIHVLTGYERGILELQVK